MVKSAGDAGVVPNLEVIELDLSNEVFALGKGVLGISWHILALLPQFFDATLQN